MVPRRAGPPRCRSVRHVRRRCRATHRVRTADGCALTAAPPDRAGRAGIRRPAPGGAGRRAAHPSRASTGSGCCRLDSVNVFCRVALPAGAGAPRPVPARDPRSARGAHRRAGPARTVRVLGARGVALPVELQPLLRWRMARASEDAWGRMRAIADEQPGLLDDVLRLVSEQGPIRAGETGIAGRARKAGRDVELARRQGRAGVPVLVGPGHRGPPGELRAALRRARAGVAGRGARRPDAAGRRASASWCGSRRVRWVSPPSPTSATTSGCRARSRRRGWPSSSRRASCCRSRSTAGRRRPTSGRTRAARAASPPARCCRPFDPLVWFRDAYRAAVRLPLPHRDLHAGAEAVLRLLRAAVPAR